MATILNRKLTIHFVTNSHNIINLDLILWDSFRSIFFADLFMNFISQFVEDGNARYKRYTSYQKFESNITEKLYNKTLYLEEPYYISDCYATEDQEDNNRLYSSGDLHLLFTCQYDYLKKPTTFEKRMLFKVNEENDIGVIVTIKTKMVIFTQVSFSRAKTMCEAYEGTYTNLKNNCDLGYLQFFTEA